MLLQTAVSPGTHPLAGTIAGWMWALPLLPLLGFLINGVLALVSVARFGPDDPSAASHATHEGESAPAETEHGDDHGSTRHRYAGITSIVGPGVLVAAFLLAVAIFWRMHAVEDLSAPFIQRYFSWMPVGDLSVDVAFRLDQLSMVMVLVVTGVGMLIHVFSVGYMHEDPGYPRYFAYLNLFVFFMLVLVLGANYPLLFIGWEGVGLCSYLLIGFWFSEKANADAGKKAFIVNRIGDFGFLIAMFLLFANFGTLDFSALQAQRRPVRVRRRADHDDRPLLLPRVHRQERPDPAVHLAARRDGRPDARLGPDPRGDDGDRRRVPHRAQQLHLRGGAGGGAHRGRRRRRSRRFFAATIGLKQWDIKKVLAYSTVSQLGYMFVGVGVGAYVGRHLPPDDARLLQGAAVPRGGLGDPRDARGVPRHPQPRRRAGHAQHGRPAPLHAGDLGGDVDRDAGHFGHSAVRRILLEGRDPRRGVRSARRAARWHRRTGWAFRAPPCSTSCTRSGSPPRC